MPSLGVAAVEAGGDFGILVQMDRFLETGVTRRDALGGAGRLFGSVTNQEIAETLKNKAGITLDQLI